MASFVTPKKNTAFSFYVGLVSQANINIFQVNPTLATGDAKVSIDGAALGNLATLPVVTPAGGKAVLVALSAAEMNGDNIEVILSDAAGAEWCDCIINIQTTAGQIDDLANFTTILPDSVAVDGTRPTINQALLELTRFLMERSVTSTTMTVKKEDGSTSSMTFTLDSSVNPSSITRAT